MWRQTCNTEQLNLITSKHDLNLCREKHITQPDHWCANENSRLHPSSGSHCSNQQFRHLVVWLLSVFTFGDPHKTKKGLCHVDVPWQESITAWITACSWAVHGCVSGAAHYTWVWFKKHMSAVIQDQKGIVEVDWWSSSESRCGGFSVQLEPDPAWLWSVTSYIERVRDLRSSVFLSEQWERSRARLERWQR